MSDTQFSVVGIVAKPHAHHLEDILPQIVELLEKYKCKVLVDDHTSHLLEEKVTSATRAELVKESDMIVVLGGDGTMLSLARYQNEVERPVIGINMGSLGFLTEIAVTEALEMTEAALQGKLHKSYRMMLFAELIRDGSVKPLQHVLNDVVINKSALARIFDVDVMIDKERITTIRADGIIVSTPTGSTAYNLAAHGPIVHPEMDVMLVTPICPHTLTYRPVVLPGDAILELSLKGTEETYLTLDGQAGFPMRRGDIVRVSRSDRRMALISPANKTFFKVLHNKLKWGDHLTS